MIIIIIKMKTNNYKQYLSLLLLTTKLSMTLGKRLEVVKMCSNVYSYIILKSTENLIKIIKHKNAFRSVNKTLSKYI